MSFFLLACNLINILLLYIREIMKSYMSLENLEVLYGWATISRKPKLYLVGFLIGL